MSRPPMGGGNFLKASDLEPGDWAEIKSEADWIDSSFTKEDGTKQQQYVCNVEYKGEERRMKLTQASCIALVEGGFGDDSGDWINKKIKLSSVQVMVGGKIRQSIFAEPMEAPEAGAPVAPLTEEAVAWDEDK